MVDPVEAVTDTIADFLCPIFGEESPRMKKEREEQDHLVEQEAQLKARLQEITSEHPIRPRSEYAAHPLPSIPSPEEVESSPMLKVLDMSFANDTFTERVCELDSANIQLATSRLTDVQNLQAKKIQEAAENAREEDTWDFLKKVASCVAGTTSILVGGVLITTGTPMGIVGGVLMIGSGVTSLTATALADLRINPDLTAGIALTSAGLSLCGGVASAFVATNQVFAIGANILSGIVSVSGGLTQIGQEEVQRLQAKIKKEQTLLDGQFTIATSRADQASQEAESEISFIKIQETTKRILQKHADTCKQITASNALAG
ncbi:MAG: hypothetical protein S4CHLAM102_03590 [Chlamydiia bacterium]|nr:hypothetical protein [Chlamydiia bacterium]